MRIENKMYKGKKTDILYPDKDHFLKNKETGLVYGAVTLTDGRKKEDFIEIAKPKKKEEKKDENSVD